LDECGVTFSPNESHITSVPIGEANRCREIAAELLNKQAIYLQPINFPTVPKGEECLPIVLNAKHRDKHLNQLAYSLNKIIKACAANYHATTI